MTTRRRRRRPSLRRLRDDYDANGARSKPALAPAPLFLLRRSKPSAPPPPPATTSSLLSMSTVSTGATRRSRVCESSLNPYSGALKCRVNRNISHLPTKCRSAKDYCQLHYWCTTKRITFSCAFCYNCNVVLCMDCYETFHSVWDLHEKKAELKEKMSKP